MRMRIIQLDQSPVARTLMRSLLHPRGSAIVIVLSCLVTGCAALRPLDGLPARYIPESLKGPSRSGRKTINLSLLSQPKPAEYFIDSGDVLGIYVDKVLGSPEEVPPVYFSRNEETPPSMGYPVPVRSDGTISLPLLSSPVHVAGKTIRQIEELLRRRYTVEEELLNPESARILVSLQKARTYRVMVIRQEASQGGFDGNGQLNLAQMKRGSGQVVSLPAYENDVLHALSATNGLPGLDARNTIFIVRSQSHRSEVSPAATGQESMDLPSLDPGAGQGAGLDYGPQRITIRQVAGVKADTQSEKSVVRAGLESQPENQGSESGPMLQQPADREPINPPVSAQGPAATPADSEMVIEPVPHGQLRHQAFDFSFSEKADEGQHQGQSRQAQSNPPPQESKVVAPRAEVTSSLHAFGSVSQHSRRNASSIQRLDSDTEPSDSLPGQVATSVPMQSASNWMNQQEVGSNMMFAQGVGWGDSTVESTSVTRIPVRLGPGERPMFSASDVVLNDGDIVFIESRQTEIFYTGGLLGGGQFMLPRDYDLDVLGAVSIAQSRTIGRGAETSVSGVSALNQDVSVSASKVIVLRKMPNGTQVTIKVDLYEALRNPAERIIIQPGDYVILQYTPVEAVGAWFERYILRSAVFGAAASQINRR